MSIATYSELQTAVADFLNREDLTAVVPTFITLAEARIARDLRHWRQEKRVSTSFDERYENLPNDWLEIIDVSLPDGQVRAISAAEMSYRYERDDTAGKPAYFRIIADQLEFYPTPDATYSGSLQYYARIPALSDTAPDNWLLAYAPDVLLYGALLHTAPYLADDARVGVWASLYQSAVDALNAENMKSRVGGPLRIGVPR